MRTQVRKIGNSLGNIIPAAFIKQLGLVEGADIEVRAYGKKLLLNQSNVKRNAFRSVKRNY